MADSEGSLLVLGLGNVLCGDDGLGVVAVHELERRYDLPAGVQAVDGGTLGLSLLTLFERRQDVVLVDAVRAEAPPGSLVRLTGDDVAPAVRTRLSVHQIGVADLLDGLRLIDAYPRRLVLLGLVPETMELGLERSAAVDANLPALVAAVAAEARALGHEVTPLPVHAHHEADPRGLFDGPVSLRR
ncbi:MAG: hydrogenase maturation protease [Acidobacteriota bacterium]|nr:hydrogenase maturation protease [Acidobacteriota bacterium]MDH3523336.1 hydrogenase maturation protease [Acidobacteriota bacterium]